MWVGSIDLSGMIEGFFLSRMRSSGLIGLIETLWMLVMGKCCMFWL